jgi:hypothetical protein
MLVELGWCNVRVPTPEEEFATTEFALNQVSFSPSGLRQRHSAAADQYPMMTMTMVGCNSPLVNNVCRDPVVAASQAVKVKRSTVIRTVCPGSETACPIVGSAALVLARANSFKDFKSSDVTALTRAGGYEW